MNLEAEPALNQSYHPTAYEQGKVTLPDTIKPTSIGGAFLIERRVFPDPRGYFTETYNIPELETVLGEQLIIKQGNESLSGDPEQEIEGKGILRGLHIAKWAKLARCSYGQVHVVVVDCQQESPTFGKAFETDLGKGHRATLYVPPGCAHGFQVTSDEAVYSYQVTDVFSSAKEIGLAWNDPNVLQQITWPVADPSMSEKDASQNAPLKKLFPRVDFSKYSWLNQP